MATRKKVLRIEYLEKFNQLSNNKRAAINQKLQNKLFNHVMWLNAETIGITVSQGHEWDTKSIIEKAWTQNKKVVVPKCEPTLKQMTFYEINDFSDLAVQFYNLLEPIVEKTTPIAKDEMDLLIVPGLIFDQENYRIGHGGGYYDRFLADFKQYTMSLVWRGQMIDAIGKEPFDQPVNELIIVE